MPVLATTYEDLEKPRWPANQLPTQLPLQLRQKRERLHPYKVIPKGGTARDVKRLSCTLGANHR